MKVTASNRYQRRAKQDLKKMIKNNDFEKLGNVAYVLNKIELWHDITFSEKEVAEQLLKDLKEVE